MLVNAGSHTLADMRLEGFGVLLKVSSGCASPILRTLFPDRVQCFFLARASSLFITLSPRVLPRCACGMEFIINLGIRTPPLRPFVACVPGCTFHRG